MHKVPKEVATAAHIYYTVKPLVKRHDVVLIDAEYDEKDPDVLRFRR